MDTERGLTMKEQKKREKKERKKERKKKRQSNEVKVDEGTKTSTVPSANKEKKDSNNNVSDQQNPSKKKRKRKEEATATVPSDLNSTNQSHQNNDPQRHPFAFEVDEADHCETPRRAYQDIIPVLDQIAKACGKDRRDLIIYDPYYCDGGVKRKLESLGCHKVINRNRDFYHDIATGQIPRHDVVLSNPPYSGSHLESLLKFVSQNYATPQQQQSKKKGSSSSLTPFLLLLPHYVYTKNYFQEYFDSDARGREGSHGNGTASTTKEHSNETNQNRQMFYLVPKNNYRYAYEPPSWVSVENGSTALARGKTQTAPFPSFWYCNVSSLMTTEMEEQQLPSTPVKVPTQSKSSWLVQTFGQSGQHHSSSANFNGGGRFGLHYASCTSHLPREFKGEFDVTNKRPNPRARKRAMAKKTVQPQQHSSTADTGKRAPPTGQTAGNGGKRKKKRY